MTLKIVAETQILSVRLIRKLIMLLERACRFSFRYQSSTLFVLAHPVDSEAGKQDPLATETSETGGVARDV